VSLYTAADRYRRVLRPELLVGNDAAAPRRRHFAGENWSLVNDQSPRVYQSQFLVGLWLLARLVGGWPAASRLIVPYPQSPKRTCLASMFAVSENSERADVRNAMSRNHWRCLNGWSELLNELMDRWTWPAVVLCPPVERPNEEDLWDGYECISTCASSPVGFWSWSGPRRDQTHTHELFRLRKPDATGEINHQRRSHARDYSVRVQRATS